MTEAMLASKIENILEIQIALFDSIYRIQREVYDFVLNRDWEKTQERMTEVEKLSEKFFLADKALVSAITESGNFSYKGKQTPDETLQLVLTTFEKPERAKLTNMIKTLKEKVYVSKIENNVLNTYLQHARDLSDDILNAVYADNSSHVYTSTGAIAGGESTNMLVNLMF